MNESMLFFSIFRKKACLQNSGMNFDDADDALKKHSTEQKAHHRVRSLLQGTHNLQ